MKIGGFDPQNGWWFIMEILIFFGMIWGVSHYFYNHPFCCFNIFRKRKERSPAGGKNSPAGFSSLWMFPFIDCLIIDQYISTLPETNIAPKNGWLEYYFPIGKP